MIVDCPYCGTPIDDDDNETATGSRHHAAKCREYVFCVKQHAKAEASHLRAAIVAMRAELVTAYREWDQDRDAKVGKRIANACDIGKAALESK